MLTRTNLTSYKQITGFNLGQIEKDYLQHIFLLNLYRKIKDELIFKGGTALQKTYGLNRFSEDLDFTKKNNIDFEPVLNTVLTNMKIFGCRSTKKKTKEDKIGINYLIKVEGPLFDGTEKSITYIRLEISKREKVLLHVNTNTVTPIYEDLPPYTIPIMNISEIMAEKIRTIYTRNKARDIYDLWFLIKKKNLVPISLINSKLKYYEKKFDMKEFKNIIEKKEKIYKQEMKQLIPIFISFNEIKKDIFFEKFIQF